MPESLFSLSQPFCNPIFGVDIAEVWNWVGGRACGRAANIKIKPKMFNLTMSIWV